MLDKKHNKPKYIVSKNNNNYAFNRINKHNIIIAIFFNNKYNIILATTVTRNIFYNFSNIKIELMIGINKKTLNKKHDIKFKNIIISSL